MPKQQRIKLKLHHPNPLFERWLEEWLQYAEEKNSMRKYGLAKALDSLRKYPLLLHSGRDCSILEGFGANTCHLLDKKLALFRSQNHQSAFLMTEQEHNVSVQEVIQIVQTKIVQKRRKQEAKSNPAKLALLDPLDSKILALYRKYDNYENNESAKVPEVEPRTSSNKDLTNLIARKTFQIILLVDTQETIGKSKRSLDATVQGLTDNKVQFEIRRLSVGDFLWICRCQQTGREVLLPYIVERKRMDDFASSIQDGRFKEQKFRLNQCGLENIVYLIENRGANQHLGLPLQNLLQAATNTQMHSKFSVKFTDSHAGSMFYLSIMTSILVRKYENRDLIIRQKTATLDECTQLSVMDFNEFSQNSIKMRNFTISDQFLRQLLQLKGLSLEKAVAIIRIYQTPKSLCDAYRHCEDVAEAELLLAKLEFGKFKKSIGPVISKTIYNLYNLRKC